MKHSKFFNSAIFIFLILQSFPLLWLLIASIKVETGLFTWDSFNVVKEFTLSNFVLLFTKHNFFLWLRNSFLISTLAATIATTAGWIFSLSIQLFVPSFFQKLRALVLVAYLIPSMFLIMSLQQVLDRFYGWVILLLLSLCYQFFLLPVAVWVSGSYASQIPNSLIALSCLDELGLVERIKLMVLPFVGKGIVAVFSLCFVMAFQEYLYALIFLKGEEWLTIPVGLTSLQAGDVFDWGIIAAASILVTILVLSILFLIGKKLLIALRYIIAG
jgi:multiple sugar transport system permease protein